MQAAHWSNNTVGLPIGRVVVVLALPSPPLFPKLATREGLGPAHALNAMPTVATRTQSPPVRWYARVLARRPGPCVALVSPTLVATAMSLPLHLVAVSPGEPLGQLYKAEGHTRVTRVTWV
jgi:hypothetical protein